MLDSWNWLNLRKKKLKFLLIWSCIFTFIGVLGKYYICIVKFFFGIPCPGCGLTRAFISIFKLDVVGAMHFNILSPLIFLFLSVILGSTFYDLIYLTEYSDKLLNPKLRYYHYAILIVLMLLSWYFNIKNCI